MRGRVFKRLANLPFRRRLASNESSNSFKRFKDATFRQLGFETLPERREDNLPATTSPNTPSSNEGVTLITSHDLSLDSQTQENAIGSNNVVQGQTADFELGQHEISLQNRSITTTSSRSVASSTSIHTPAETMFPAGPNLDSCGEETNVAGILVPQEMINNWNNIFHCGRKIREQNKRLKRYEGYRDQASKLVGELQDDDMLQEMIEAREEACEEIAKIEKRISTKQNILPEFEQAFFNDWEQFMRTNNLISAPPEASEGSVISDSESETTAEEDSEEYRDQIYDPCQFDEPSDLYESDYMETDIPHSPIESTRNEVNQISPEPLYADEIEEVLRIKGLRLANAQAKLGNWDLHCEEKRNSLMESGQPIDEVVALNYHLELYLEKSQATRELIEAEEDLERMKAHYRNLGIYILDDDQESHFQDRGDDGLYFDHDGRVVTKFVDLEWVQRWVDKQIDLCGEMQSMKENTERGQDDAEMEITGSWRFTQEVEPWESWTTVARDGARRRIDYWRDACKDWPASRLEGAAL